MDSIDLLASLPIGSDLEPTVLVYKGPMGIKHHHGALIDETRFVVWRSQNGRTEAEKAFQDALAKLDDYNGR